MFSITPSILNIYFISVASAIGVDFGGYFDSPKKWTYHYEVKQATEDWPLREGTLMTQILKMQDQMQVQQDLEMQEQLPLQQQLRSHKKHKTEKGTNKHKGNIRHAELKKKVTVYYDENEHPSTKDPHDLDDQQQETKDSVIEENSWTVTEKYEEETTKYEEDPYYNTSIDQSLNENESETSSVPHLVEYNIEVQTFTIHILESGLKVFDEMKNKTTDYTMKRKLDKLATSYEYKYKEFLNDTYRQEIKTKLGTQKVILNAIEVSDRIINRLLNQVVIDLDKKGHLRGNIATINDFRHEVHKETDQQFRNLCTEFNICRSGGGFSNFLNDFLTTILRCNDGKIQLAIDALTEVVKITDFKNTFHKKTRKQIKNSIDRIERQNLSVLKPGLMVIRNIIANKNKPLAVRQSDMPNSRINSTIALLEIIEALEMKLPKSEANIQKWEDLRTSIDEWEEGKRNDIQDIMGMFVKYIKTTLDGMPSSMQDHVAENFSRFLKRH